MENRDFLVHAAEVFTQNQTLERINAGQRMTIGEVKRLLMTATVNGRKLEFYELEGPVAKLAQAKNDDSLALTFVRSVLDNARRIGGQK